MQRKKEKKRSVMPYAKLTPNQHLYEGEYKNYYLKNGIRTFYIAKIENTAN